MDANYYGQIQNGHAREPRIQEIIERLGYVPAAPAMRDALKRIYDIKASINKVLANYAMLASEGVIKDSGISTPRWLLSNQNSIMDIAAANIYIKQR